MDHPRRSKTQLFRQNMSYRELKAIFDNPRVHTGAGYYRRRRVSAARGEPAPPAGADWRKRFYCSLPCTEMNRFALDAWKELDVETFALGSHALVVVGAEGEAWWIGDVPRGLIKAIKRFQAFTAVDYVAMGPDGSYFVQFCNGKRCWEGPESLTEVLLHPPGETQLVELLAFAPDDGWYVMFQDGLSDWSDLPVGLHNLLKGRSGQMWLPEVDELSCGPCGEWFVRFMDGRIKVGGLESEVRAAMNLCRRQGRRIMGMQFGQDPEEGGWLIRHDGAKLVLV